MDYGDLLGKLPERSETHVKNDMARLAFRNIFSDPLFIVREETDNDYGVDICIEALINNGTSPTNVRSHVQLKSSSKKPNGRGDYSYSVSLSNLNYLLNHPCSFYSLYAIEENVLYYCYAEDVYAKHCSSKENWNENKTVTINFSNVIDAETIHSIHQQLLDTTILLKEIRLKLFKDGIKPGVKFVYGDFLFESSNQAFQEYQDKHGVSYAYTMDKNGKVIFMHNIIWESHHGPIPKGYQVFHINGNTLDNRSKNLDIIKTLEILDVDRFQKEIEALQEYNILSLIVGGSEADFQDVPPPPKSMFNRIINELKAEGWNASEEEMTKIMHDLHVNLGMEFDL
ncbi:hypothetical protein JCM15765_21510 [Paradesulfitobacterium aromaticivorans]